MTLPLLMARARINHVAQPVSTAYRDAVDADIPLHYYRFSESAGTVLYNRGTSGVDGSYTSDASNWTGPGLITGDATRGLVIPSSFSFESIVNAGAVTNTDFSAEVVVRPTAIGGTAGGAVVWSYGPTASSCPGLDYVDAGSGKFRLRYMNVGTAVVFASASAYPYGTKLHVVIRHTRSTNLCEMWISGVKEASTGTFVASTNAYNMYIGVQYFPPQSWLVGGLDEFAYYDHLLSPARIAAHAALV